ncbi:flagellar export protein FliJ [Lacticigenium naphthae]|uniref:flagellar export protein FliJ n=1 Tax=Lacticigenium naphthae TaxID=515351 RepID=UPI0003F6BB1D|nr:flagellar export protein FliJ [Lacticigenium naphthae]
MSRYQFSMEKILDWRKDKAKQAQQTVLEAEANLHKEQATLEKLLRESLQLKYADLKSNDIDGLRHHDLYKSLVSEKVVTQKTRVNRAEEVVREMQAALAESHKEKRVLEKLQEKEESAYYLAEKKEEQKELDEMATIQFGRFLY